MCIQKRTSAAWAYGNYFYDNLEFLTRLDIKALPSRKAFINKLGSVKCSQSEYAHAQHVWDNFYWQSLKEYKALY